MRADLYHHPSVRPLLRIVSMLSLNGNLVTWLEWRKIFTPSSELLSFQEVTLSIRCGSGIGSLSPFLSGLKFTWLQGQKVS